MLQKMVPQFVGDSETLRIGRIAEIVRNDGTLPIIGIGTADRGIVPRFKRRYRPNLDPCLYSDFFRIDWNRSPSPEVLDHSLSKLTLYHG